MTREEICNSMTVQDAIKVFEVTNCYGTMDIAKSVILKALEQKMGYWIHDGSNWKNRWICSECGYKLFDEQTRFCPNCGARMRGEQK